MKPLGDDNKPVGVKDNLIDKNGFPRNDIDIHTIRIKRNRYACLQTDHKELMKKIEVILADIMKLPFDSSSNNQSETKSKNHIKPSKSIELNLVPFIRVEAVDKSSPAEESGLIVGDVLLKFGTQSYNGNLSPQEVLSKVVNIVGENINDTIDVIVERNLEKLNLNLVPKEWSGRGFLGCKLVPI